MRKTSDASHQSAQLSKVTRNTQDMESTTKAAQGGTKDDIKANKTYIKNHFSFCHSPYLAKQGGNEIFCYAWIQVADIAAKKKKKKN